MLCLGFGAAVAAGRSFDSRRNSSMIWRLEADLDLFSCPAELYIAIVNCFARITRDTAKLAFDVEHIHAVTVVEAFVDAT